MNFNSVLWVILFLRYGSEGKVLTFIQDKSITNRHFADGRLGTVPSTGGLAQCVSKCYMEQSCVSVGYSPVSTSCQLYNLDVANFTENVIFQKDTDFYKVVCENHDYTYIRSLNVCMKLYSIQTWYPGAIRKCYFDDGAQLLTFDTYDKRHYLKGILAHIHDNGYRYYVGGYSYNNEYQWFHTFATIDSSNGGLLWGVGEPNLSQGACVSIYSEGGEPVMATTNCFDQLMFICTIDM